MQNLQELATQRLPLGSADLKPCSNEKSYENIDLPLINEKKSDRQLQRLPTGAD